MQLADVHFGCIPLHSGDMRSYFYTLGFLWAIKCIYTSSNMWYSNAYNLLPCKLLNSLSKHRIVNYDLQLSYYSTGKNVQSWTGNNRSIWINCKIKLQKRGHCWFNHKKVKMKLSLIKIYYVTGNEPHDIFRYNLHLFNQGQKLET